jgi:hypothetical protein
MKLTLVFLNAFKMTNVIHSSLVWIGVEMPIIIGVNPVRRKKTGRKKPMAKKRARKRSVAKAPATRWRTRTVTKYRTRKAAMTARRKRPRGARREEPLNIQKIVRGSVAAGVGMVIAKVAVNKLTTGGSEQERWSWPNIFMAGGASMVAAFAAGALFKLKKPTVALVATGGVALALYKVFTCKIAPKWGWSESWFGADDVSIHPDFLGAGEDEFEVVDYQPSVGYLPGQYGAANTGGQLVPFNPNMGATNTGGQVVAFNPNMGFGDSYQSAQRRVSGESYPGSY